MHQKKLLSHALSIKHDSLCIAFSIELSAHSQMFHQDCQCWWICYAQTVDLRNPGIVLRKPGLDPWFVVQSMDWPRNPRLGCSCAKHRLEQSWDGPAQSIDQTDLLCISHGY